MDIFVSCVWFFYTIGFSSINKNLFILRGLKYRKRVWFLDCCWADNDELKDAGVDGGAYIWTKDCCCWESIVDVGDKDVGDDMKDDV